MVPPETSPISAFSLKSKRFIDRSAKMLVRVRFCDIDTGLALAAGLGGTVRAATCAPISVDASYLSWPKPAASPKRIKLLLAVTRHALVLRLRLLTYSESLPLLPAMFNVGRSRTR